MKENTVLDNTATGDVTEAAGLVAPLGGPQ